MSKVIYSIENRMILVDHEMFEMLSRIEWEVPLEYPSYFDRDNKQTTIFMHHLILPKKEGFDVDHINRNRLDNRRKNLRYLTRSENMHNTTLRVDNTSGYKGVCYFMGRNAWKASITVAGKRIILGMFPKWEDAVAARKTAELKYLPNIYE